MKTFWTRFGRRIKYYLIRVFRERKGASQVAFGIVLGFFPCWFPTFGVGPAMSVALARFAGANVVGAITAAALGSFLWPVLFFLNYRMGALFTDRWEERRLDEVKYDGDEYVKPIEEVNTLGDIGLTFVVGSVLNSILFTIAGYFVLKYVFSRYRLTILRKLRGSSGP